MKKRIIYNLGEISIIFFPLFLFLTVMSLFWFSWPLKTTFITILILMGIMIYLMLKNKYVQSAFPTEEKVNK